ncbi:MAG: YgjV family protein [Bacteroidales bacterium]|nr:YgjV family protein [Bacteroidales bacterium]
MELLLSIEWFEWIGYMASVTVAVSLVMSSIVKLRWYNLLGAILFTIYGIIIGAWPVAVVNGFIIVIDIYYLVKMYTHNSSIKVVDVNADSSYLKEFISIHDQKLRSIFTNYNGLFESNDLCYLLLNDMQVAGFFIGRKENNTLNIIADFALPEYRDMKLGKYIFSSLSPFKQHNIDKVTCSTSDKKHIDYLHKINFKETSTGVYQKLL